MPSNLMFSSPGSNAVVKILEVHLFGSAYTYTKRMRLKKEAPEDIPE